MTNELKSIVISDTDSGDLLSVAIVPEGKTCSETFEAWCRLEVMDPAMVEQGTTVDDLKQYTNWEEMTVVTVFDKLPE